MSGVIVVKEIKPSRLDSSIFMAAFETAARVAAEEIAKDFEATTRTWSKKPSFQRLVSVGPASIDVLVGTDDPIYGYVDEGTRPHVIVPVHAKRLIFQAGYKAKTTPGVIGSQGGGPFGKQVAALIVRHPGTEARNFSKTIQKKWQPKFKKLMEAALRQAVAASGQEMK